MRQPNILLIFTDQQRWDTIHAIGNPVIRTPHLDRLVREGVHFTNAFTASPVCVSARCSLVYGQYPHKTGCADNGDAMPANRPSLMDLLSEAGYRTHGVGKMHFAPDAQALRASDPRAARKSCSRASTMTIMSSSCGLAALATCSTRWAPAGRCTIPRSPRCRPGCTPRSGWGIAPWPFPAAARGQPFFLFASFIIRTRPSRRRRPGTSYTAAR